MALDQQNLNPVLGKALADFVATFRAALKRIEGRLRREAPLRRRSISSQKLGRSF